MTHNSRKAWKIIKHLSKYPTSPIAPCLVSTNQVAHQLLINSRGTMFNKPKRPVLSPTAKESMVYPFSEEEYRRGIATLNNNKAAGIDEVLVEQLKGLGPNTYKWLLAMLNNCFTQNKIPTIIHYSISNCCYLMLIYYSSQYVDSRGHTCRQVLFLFHSSL